MDQQKRRELIIRMSGVSIRIVTPISGFWILVSCLFLFPIGYYNFVHYIYLDGNVELGVDALTSPEDTARLFDQVDEIEKKERLVLESGCIVMTFETGSGNNTTPVLLVESDINMQAFDWSQKVSSKINL